MARATEYQARTRDPGRTCVIVGGTLVALAAPAAVVGALLFASDGDLLARVLAVFAADPATLPVTEALVYWGVAVAAVGGWLVGVGLVLDGLAEE